jgi:hypothetical protein
MRTFEIVEISNMSGLSIGQIEQAISREKLPVQGKGRPRQFLRQDAFNFCLIGEMRKLGIDWKRIVGSTAIPWPVPDVFELDGNHFLLLAPMPDGNLDMNITTADDILRDLRALKASGGILIDASVIAKRIEVFARRH